MDRLRKTFEAIDAKNIRIYLQSGNIVFDFAEDRVADLTKKIQKRIFSDFCFDVDVLVLTVRDIKRAKSQNPFSKKEGNPAGWYVTFLFDKPKSTEGLDRLKAAPAGQDQFCVKNQVVYVCCPNGYGRSAASVGLFEVSFQTSIDQEELG